MCLRSHNTPVLCFGCSTVHCRVAVLRCWVQTNQLSCWRHLASLNVGRYHGTNHPLEEPQEAGTGDFAVGNWFMKAIGFHQLNLSRMDLEGYRRMRTTTQFAFESVPQFFLQLRFLVAFREEAESVGKWSTRTRERERERERTKGCLWVGL